jgi:chitinase
MADPAYVHSGTHSMSVHFTSAWAGLQLGSNGFNTTGYNRITFWINGGASSGQQMEIYVADANGNYLPSRPLNNYISGGSVRKNSWSQVSIPLADLGATNRVITAIVLQDTTGNAQSTYYVDDLQFAGQ